MKRYALIMAFSCGFFGVALGERRGTYKLKKAIETSNFEKAQKGIKIAGQLDSAEKIRLLELADDMIALREKIKMSRWDWLKFLTGAGLSTLLLNAYDYAMEINQAAAGNARSELVQNSILCGALGGIGLFLVRSGLRCNAARNLLSNAQKIEEILRMAPQKSFNTTQMSGIHKKEKQPGNS